MASGHYLIAMTVWVLAAILLIPDADASSGQWLLSSQAQTLGALAGIQFLGFTFIATAASERSSHLRRRDRHYGDLLCGEADRAQIDLVLQEYEERLVASPRAARRDLSFVRLFGETHFQTEYEVYVALCVLCYRYVGRAALSFDAGFDRLGWEEGKYIFAAYDSEVGGTPLGRVRLVYNLFVRTPGMVSFGPRGSLLQQQVNESALDDDLAGAFSIVERARALRGWPFWWCLGLTASGIVVSLVFLAGTTQQSFHSWYLYVSSGLALSAMASMFDLLRKYVVIE